MRTLTDSEKRTVRIAGILIAVYLVCFGGLKTWKWLDGKRQSYKDLNTLADGLKRKVEPYGVKAESVTKLMESYRMDPMGLTTNSLVADASIAIQRAAGTAGVQLGPIRESAPRKAAKETATIQLEATGPVPGILGFIQRFENLGFPVIIDSIQIHTDPAKPGGLKLNLTVVILDFTQWKSEAPRA
jgi:hypothetical protein